MKISLKDGALCIDNKEVDLSKSTLVFKSQLPKSWEELEMVNGYFVSTKCNILHILDAAIDRANYNIYATEAQAKASIAMAQLSQLMAAYNDGWEADWTNNSVVKYCLIINNDKVSNIEMTLCRAFLAFKNPQLRDEFAKNFEDLIMQAKPLL